MHTDALSIWYIQAVLEVIEPRHIISFFIFLLFDWDDLDRKVERNFDLQSLDPTNLLVMVGWNTQQGQQPRLSLSLPATAKDIRRDIVDDDGRRRRTKNSFRPISISASPIDRYATSPNSFLFYFLFSNRSQLKYWGEGVYFLTLGPGAPNERNVTVLHYG